jgi:hypothetical protein
MEDNKDLRRQELLAKEAKKALNDADDPIETESVQVAQLRQENMQLRVFLTEVEQHSNLNSVSLKNMLLTCRLASI